MVELAASETKRKQTLDHISKLKELLLAIRDISRASGAEASKDCLANLHNPIRTIHGMSQGGWKGEVTFGMSSMGV